MEYSKKICINNLYKLIKTKNLKMGEVENRVGVSVGYFSKLLKEGNTASPSIEVLCNAANLLDVSLDTLCKRDLSTISESDLYIFNFLSSLLKRTNEGEFIWTKESENELNDSTVNTIEFKSKELFDFVDVPYKGETDYPEYHERIVYKSAFRKGELLEALDNSYYLELPNGAIVFLMKIHRINNNRSKEIDRNWDIEVYVQSYDKIDPIARYQTEIDLLSDNIVLDLYRAAEKSSKHCIISKSAKEIIDSYMNMHKL